MNTKPRERYIAGPSPKGATRPWTVTRDGEVLGEWETQGAAVEAAVRVCRYRLKVLGKRAELQIKGVDGKIRDSRTYGDDPPETKG